MSPTTLAHAIAAGVLLGCFYALMALGFSMIRSVTRALNLTHGDLIILGGYLGYWLWIGSGLHPLFLVPVAAAALLPLALGWQWLFQRLREPKELSSLVLTFGLSLFLQNGMLALWPGEYRLIASEALTASVSLGGLTLNRGRLLVAGAALAAVGSLHVALGHSRWGRAVRATSVDREAAALLGINVDQATQSTFLLAFALSGGVGVLFATLHYLSPSGGAELTLLAIVLTIWSGAGHTRGVLGAGILLGVIETLTLLWSGPRWRELVVALMLLGTLLARAGGLVPRRRR